MERKYKGFFAIIFSLFLSAFLGVFAQNREGIKLFEQGKAAEAIAFLQSDIDSGTALAVEYNYLGLAYYQIGQYAKSVEAFRRGLSAPGTNKKQLYYNMGNAYYLMRDFDNAINSYTMASVADPNFGEPVLNKANAELSQDRLTDAQTDYRRYLVLCPDTPQRPEIEKILAMIDEELVLRKEAERLAAEEAARLKAEEERLAAEKARLEKEAAEKRAEEERLAAEKRAEQERIAAEQRAVEEARRRKMLEDVAASLRQNSETTNISADAESSIEYEYESDIE